MAFKKFEEGQYKEIMESIPEFLKDVEFTGDKLLVRLFSRKEKTKSGLFVPDTKQVPTKSELDVKTELASAAEAVLYRGVVIGKGVEASDTFQIGSVVDLSPAINRMQLFTMQKQFNYGPDGKAELENFYLLPPSFIAAVWKTSEAYLDYLESLSKTTELV